MLDSLKIGPKPYVDLRNSYWEKIRGENSDKLPNYVGEGASPLTADFWFTRNGDSVIRLPEAPEQRPFNGRISMVVFYDIRCNDNTPVFIGRYHRSHESVGCLQSYPILRRLHQSYPEMQVTIFSLTDGYIGNSEPMSPEEEAQQKSIWWLGTHQLPGILGVAEQKFFKLPEPDGRRIDEPNENSINYLFGANGRVRSGVFYLIDEDGTVIFSGGLDRYTEKALTQLLDIVTSRP